MYFKNKKMRNDNIQLTDEELNTYMLTAPVSAKTVNDLFPYGKYYKDTWDEHAEGKDHILISSTNQVEEKVVGEDDWKYYINKYNFRGKWNLNSKKPMAGFFGCSFTFGEGIAEEETFADIVSYKCGLNGLNFGIGGSSLDRIARTFAAAANVLDLEYAIFTLPAWRRRMHINEHGQIINLIPQWPHENYKKISKQLTELDDEFYVTSSISTVEWIVSVAKLHNIKIILSSWDYPLTGVLKKMYPDITIDPFPNIDDKCARDGMHPGTKSQAAHARQITRMFNDKSWVSKVKW